jgi:predicted DNA-binding antitoxin AbrB/MazE fold protein
MQALRAIYNDGQFVMLENLDIPEGNQAIITVLDFPAWNDTDNLQLAAFNAFMTEIHANGEEVPVFERAQLHREVEL